MEIASVTEVGFNPLFLLHLEDEPSQEQIKIAQDVCRAQYKGPVDDFGESGGASLAEEIVPEFSGFNDEAPKKKGFHLFIFPREGVISPWSGEATEIARLAGLKLLRLEYATLATGVKTADSICEQSDWELWLYDRMIEQASLSLTGTHALFQGKGDAAVDEPVIAEVEALGKLNQRWGLSLSSEDIEHLCQVGQKAGRELSASEVMMYAQVNSEHCRHKLFNARWRIAGEERKDSLFSMIKRSHEASPSHTLEAYHDNAAVIAGSVSDRWHSDIKSGQWCASEELGHYCIKVESHNHPTAVLPFAGAATGAGGEIRDESATGRGAMPLAGFSGYMVSEPVYRDHQGRRTEFPENIRSAKSIMIDAPLGASRFNNEFGRPSLTGFFRSLWVDRDVDTEKGKKYHQRQSYRHFGYHKPVMLAGGFGLLRAMHQKKRDLDSGALIVVIGGPAMRLGIGGGSLSSQANQSSGDDRCRADLDYASVQRSNPEMQRRCHEVLRKCIDLGEETPILSIHDVGAGGLSNAVCEIVDQSHKGARVDLDKVPSLDSTMSPMEIWCNESQERYVLVIEAADRSRFAKICSGERCPCAVIGEVTDERRIVARTAAHGEAINFALDDLIEPQRRLIEIGKEADIGKGDRQGAVNEVQSAAKSISKDELKQTLHDVLRQPVVGHKGFLVTICDRSVGGLTVRDQMVGPFQVPIADVAVSRFGFTSDEGIAMAIGERANVAVSDPVAACRMAFVEALTNLYAANVPSLDLVRLSANWMVSSGNEKNDSELYEAVRSLCEDLAIPLSISIPVGKDSVSMRTAWQAHTFEGRLKQYDVESPLTLVITAYARLDKADEVLTPYLPEGELLLYHLPLSEARGRLGGSVLASVQPKWLKGQHACPDINDASCIKHWCETLRVARGKLLAYHDISDGGLLTTVAEMAMASRRGVCLDFSREKDLLPALFSEEAGIVVAVSKDDGEWLEKYMSGENQPCRKIGECTQDLSFVVKAPNWESEQSIFGLWNSWVKCTSKIEEGRKGYLVANYEFLPDELAFKSCRLFVDCKFDPSPPNIDTRNPKVPRPKAAILREQGCNGHPEMAWAFERSGFDAFDVSMADLLKGRFNLSDFKLLAACGGFSYGDVLGAGWGWALGVLKNVKLRDSFEAFFHRDDTLALGICNGCQLLTHIRELIPECNEWPEFGQNKSQKFESRLVMVKVLERNSIWLESMGGSSLPIVVANGEGCAQGEAPDNLVALRYIDPASKTATKSYPHNPSGSEDAIAGLCSKDGRVLAMMPHPERLTETWQFSWLPEKERERPSPWLRLFLNARRYFD